MNSPLLVFLSQVRLLLPELLLFVAFMAAVTWSFWGSSRIVAMRWFLIIVFLIAAGLLVEQIQLTNNPFSAEWAMKASFQAFGEGALIVDTFSIYARLLVVVGLLMWMLESQSDDSLIEHSQLFLLPIALGLFLCADANDLGAMFLGIECASIGLFCMAVSAGVGTSKVRPLLALLIGFSGLVVLGIALLFGTAGTTNYFDLLNAVAAHDVQLVRLNPLLLGSLLIAVGVLLKVLWVPSALARMNERSFAFAWFPVLFGLGGLFGLARFVLTSFPAQLQPFAFRTILSVIGGILLCGGAILSVRETRIVRLIGLHVLSCVGMLVIAFSTQSLSGLAAFNFGTLTLLVSAFGALHAARHLCARGENEVRDLARYGRRFSVQSAMMLLALASLAGIPLTSGFAARFFSYASFQSGSWLSLMLILSIPVSLVSVFRLGSVLFARECNGNLEQMASSRSKIPAIIFAAVIIVLGFPGFWDSFLRASESCTGTISMLISGSETTK